MMGGQSVCWKNPPMNHFSRKESLMTLHHDQENSIDLDGQRDPMGNQINRK